MLRRTAALVALALAAFAALASPALARTIDVANTADSGAGSLRATLAAAVSGDVVHVPAGTYVLSSGALSIPAGVTVAGDGARGTIVSGGGVSGVFTTAGAGVVVQDLTVTAGRAAAGAGIHTNFGLVLHRAAITSNIATSNGGGIDNEGPQPLLIDHSLIASNQAPNGTAGGVDVDGTSTTSAIVATTIAGNSASSAAGGVYVDEAPALLDGDTFFGNSLSGVGGQGGNFRVHADSVTLRNTVLAGGVATAGGDCYLSGGSTLVSLGYNAEDTDRTPDSDCMNDLRGPGDRTGLALQLGALQDNGGPTDTLLPAAGSPLVDAGNTANCSATDQRGVPRPQGAACDIGAVERTTAAIGTAFAGAVTGTSATLHATADTIGLGGSARFAYGPTTGYGAFTATLGLPIAAGAQGLSATLTGLLPGTTYHYRLLVTTPDGAVTGADSAFKTTTRSPPPVCKVPKLTNLSLSHAGRALAKAHCKLGKVTYPRARRGARARRAGLVVRKQSRRAGARFPDGAHVNVTLGPKPKPKPKKRHARG